MAAGSLSAGRLRHRIVIQERVTLINSNGEQETAWEEFATVWAAIEPLSVRESLMAQQVQSKTSGRMVIRKLPGILASMRVLHLGTVYNVQGILSDPDSGLEYQTLMVDSGVNAG